MCLINIKLNLKSPVKTCEAAHQTQPCQAWREALQCWKRSLELAPNNTGLRQHHEGLQRLYDAHCGRKKAPEV